MLKNGQSSPQAFCLLATLTVVLTACSSEPAKVVPAAMPPEAVAAYRLVRIDVDADNNAQTDAVYTLLYDSSGLASTELIDNEGDGAADEEFRYTYAMGLLLRSELDVGIDGSIDSVREYNYTVGGVLLSELIDDGNDGTVNRRIDYTAVNDNVTGAVFDNDNDGQAEDSVAYVRDVAGRVVQTGTDRDGDGNPDVRVTFNYDAEGRVVRSDTDIGDDGSVDAVANYTWEAAICDFRSNHQPLQHSCVRR